MSDEQITRPSTLEPTNQTECDKEPIHIPGCIQPYGVLMAVSDGGIITRVSDNCGRLLGASPDSLLGSALSSLVAVPLDLRLEGCATRSVEVSVRGEEFLVTAHLGKESPILEWEPMPAASAGSNSQWIRLSETIGALQSTSDLESLFLETAGTVQALTGFDRVMVYRFDEEWHGEVIAEKLASDEVESYAGQRFPASDIPSQARAIFLSNWLRMIPEVDYTPSRIVPELSPDQGLPLDMSGAYLRNPSPIHLQYLRNMGVAASLTLSLLKEGKLWGLVACHHRKPLRVPPGLRGMMECVARLVSALIPVREAKQEAEYRARSTAIKRQLWKDLEQSGDLASRVVSHSPNLLDLIPAKGAAVSIDLEGRWSTLGTVPTESQLNELAHWLAAEHPGKDIYTTENLSAVYPAAEQYKEIASGLLAISIPKSPLNYLMWFREEVVQTVRWAGNPEKTMESMDGQLHPRKSFELWRQRLENRSLPWTCAEKEAASDIRRALIERDLKRQFEKEKQSSRSKEEILYIVSHDLKNPLRGIGLSAYLLRKLADFLPEEKRSELTEALQGIRQYSENMSTLIQRLLDVARIESGNIPLVRKATSTTEVLSRAFKLFEPLAKEAGVMLWLEDNATAAIHVDTEGIVQVLSNLLSNALKFTPRGGRITLGSQLVPGAVSLFVADTGQGIPAEKLSKIFERFWHSGQDRKGGIGLGLAIAKGLVEAHEGTLEVQSTLGAGTRFSIRLPS